MAADPPRFAHMAPDSETAHADPRDEVSEGWPHRVANSVAGALRSAGFEASAKHSKNTAGYSSYLSVNDPQTGRYIPETRISDHMVGPVRGRGSNLVSSPSEARDIVKQAHEMRGMGPTQTWKDREALKGAGQDGLVGKARDKALARLRAAGPS